MHFTLLHKGRTIQIHLNPHIGIFKGFEEFIGGFPIPIFDVPWLLHSTKIMNEHRAKWFVKFLQRKAS